MRALILVCKVSSSPACPVGMVWWFPQGCAFLPVDLVWIQVVPLPVLCDIFTSVKALAAVCCYTVSWPLHSRRCCWLLWIQTCPCGKVLLVLPVLCAQSLSVRGESAALPISGIHFLDSSSAGCCWSLAVPSARHSMCSEQEWLSCHPCCRQGQLGQLQGQLGHPCATLPSTAPGTGTRHGGKITALSTGSMARARAQGENHNSQLWAQGENPQFWAVSTGSVAGTTAQGKNPQFWAVIIG